MNSLELIARGDKAKRLLEEPLLSEAFQMAEDSILHMFRTAADDKAVIRSKQLMTALTLVRRALEQAVSDGKIAARTLEEQKRGTLSYLGDVWRSRMQRS